MKYFVIKIKNIYINVDKVNDSITIINDKIINKHKNKNKTKIKKSSENEKQIIIK